MDELTDDQLIAALQSSDQLEVNKALKGLYARYYPVIANFVSQNNGSADDAADIFQDAIIVFYRKIRTGELQLNCSVLTYLYSVCRNLWLYRLRGRKKQVQLNDELESIPIDENSLDVLMADESKEQIASLMARLGEGCQRILRYFYFDRLRMRDIAQRMGLANEQVAKNKKAGCMKKLKTLIGESPGLQQLFR
ncbi:MAG: sigma-70 family RNA polymerase sigma factor [Bacteroidota bacterium]